METTDKPLSFGSQERKLRPRGGKGLRSLCKSGPKLGLEPDPGGPAWRPGPSWEAAHWVCQGLRPAPLGAAQEGPSAFSVSPPPPPCLTPVWITFSPVPSQALPEVWLPPLLVPGNPGALAVWQPRPGWSHADSCQTVAVWAEEGLFTQGRAQAEAAASSPRQWPIILTPLSPSVFAHSINIYGAPTVCQALFYTLRR